MRYLMQFLILVVLAMYNKLNIFGTRNQLKFLIGRGVTGAINLGTLYLSIKVLYIII